MDGIKFSEFPLRWTPISGSSNNNNGGNNNSKGKKDNPPTAPVYYKNDTSHLINIPLRGILANYIRMELTHSNHWLLLSEVFFDSRKSRNLKRPFKASTAILQSAVHGKVSDKLLALALAFVSILKFFPIVPFNLFTLENYIICNNKLV